MPNILTESKVKMNYILGKGGFMKKSFIKKSLEIFKPKKKTLNKGVSYLIVGVIGYFIAIAFQESKEKIAEDFLRENYLKMPPYHGYKETFIGASYAQGYRPIDNEEMLNYAKMDLASGRIISQKKGMPKLGDTMTYLDGLHKVLDTKKLEKRLKYKAPIQK